MPEDNPGRGDPHNDEVHHHEEAHEAWESNRKRTYDTYQENDLTNRASGADHARNVNQIAELALSNAVAASHAMTMQMITHRDFAINKTWNLNETDLIAANAATAGGAINAAIAKHVQDTHS